jgi:tellurite resistance protein
MPSSSSPTISPQAALVYVMVIAAVADGQLKDSELSSIAQIARHLPVFNGLGPEDMERAVGDCATMLDQADGIDAVMGLAKQALPERLRETAYALACDIVAVDGLVAQEELRWLEILRDELGIDRLHAGGIERGARARYIAL